MATYDVHDKAVMARINKYIQQANLKFPKDKIAVKLEWGWSQNIAERESSAAASMDNVGRDADYYFAARHAIAANKTESSKCFHKAVGSAATVVYIGLKEADKAAQKLGAPPVMRANPKLPNAPPASMSVRSTARSKSKSSFRSLGAAMNVCATSPAKSPLIPCSRCAAIAFLAIATILSPAFWPAATAAPQASTIVALADIREAWVQDLRTKQLEPILKFYAPDAVFLQPTGERITGSAALRTLFQTIMATFNSDLTLHSQNLETSGALAYDSGDFQETLTVIATGAKITAKGSYIIIFKRQPNGSWQIVQHVFTGAAPPGT
jgi:ketosteroid isomerase-like protein